MSATAEAPSRNGDGPKHEAVGYRQAVKAQMQKYEAGADGAVRQVEPEESEVDQFLLECQFYDLNPLVGQIYAVWEKGVMRAVTTIDGLRALSVRTGADDGQDDPEWCDAEGNWRDFWGGGEHPTAARVRVYRKDTRRPLTGTANWSDFAPSGVEGTGAMWDETGGMPAHMLSIRAEAIARRKAFPAELSGLYTAEELGISPGAIGGGDQEGGAPATDIPPTPPGSAAAAATAPATGAEAAPASAAEAPTPAAEEDAAPSVIVDAPSGQPSGPPARPQAKRDLAETIASSEYARLRSELTEALFAQMPDRLTDEQSERMGWLLADAEGAGVTAVELERLCKVVLTEAPSDAPARERAIAEWIAERRRQADEERSQPAQHPEVEEGDPLPAEEGVDVAPQPESLLDADPGPEASE